MGILTEILQQKEKEVTSLKEQPLPESTGKTRATPSFVQTISSAEHMTVIAEIKRASPSKGSIDPDVDPARKAALYEACGAGAISVLTDEPFFKGSMDDLRTIRQTVNVPLLAKDFFIDQVQIDHAKAAGASIILLIVAAMSPFKLQNLFAYAKEQKLDVLCEVHNEQEMMTAIELGADVIGINNRDLNTFTVDLATTGQLASLVTNPDTLIISESGLASRRDAQQAAHAGARAVLMGETLMRSDDVRGMVTDLRVPLPEGGHFHAR
ncbi:indole-3-glycerol phosphate synthase TrpC [Barrientosiimonas marina]|uniref:Indole-3-glycerol phosphate synthase n=1 Tax=Lentibacillus kimchii TaxID=1542911 RepID=A0ABW2USM2_9BACI